MEFELTKNYKDYGSFAILFVEFSHTYWNLLCCHGKKGEREVEGIMIVSKVVDNE